MTSESPTPADDPRLRSEYVEECPGTDGGRIVLVGVVHDHPASAYRVRRVIEHVAPAVIALELPSLALPLFKQVARDRRTSPRNSDEMSAAIQAGMELDHEVTVKAIDLPNVRFAGTLAGVLHDGSPTPGTLRDVGRKVWGVTKHAIRCRVAASASWLVSDDDVIRDVDHAVSAKDPAGRQAEHEAIQLARSQSLLGAIERPAAMRLTDTARERTMADALSTLADGRDVVAVVGFDHLPRLSAYLE